NAGGWQKLFQHGEARCRHSGQIVTGEQHSTGGVDGSGVKLELVFGQVSSQNESVGIIPPQSSVLPVPQQILARRGCDAVPASLDVIRATGAVNHPKRRPDRMIASQDETVAGTAKDCLHAAPIRFDARGIWIVKLSSMDSAPKIGIEFEIGAAPVAT